MPSWVYGSNEPDDDGDVADIARIEITINYLLGELWKVTCLYMNIALADEIKPASM